MFDDLDYLLKNLEILKDYLKSEEKNLVNNKNINNLRKVIDHIKLEHYRNMNLDDKIGKEVEKILNENMNSIDNQIFEQIGDNMKSIESDINKKMDKINVESITVISIFSAIIMAFFGGLSFFGDSLKNMNQVNLNLTLSVITSVGISMFNIFYILLKFFSRYIFNLNQYIAISKY